MDAHLGEECDHGAGNSDTTPNACRAHCRDPWCGDGVLDTGEECDVGADNGVSPSPCRETCIVNVCGDGYLGGDEVCDDGNTEDGDDCRGDCGQDLTLCGNGVLDPGEQCDDGATGGGDGCDATCQVEQGWICTGAGATSVCSCAPLYTGDDCDSCVVFVSQEGTVTPPDGQSWASAFPRVQEGIDAAQAAGPGCEVWVARGTYYTYENDANDTLHLRSGVSVYGGFAGTETQREDRNPTAQLTLLDGRREGHLTTHVNTVITAVDVEDALLDGFTVSFGQASGVGGGMRIEGGSPSVTGCTFSGNQAPSGAGMYISGSTATITACTFSGNTANGMGGGLLVDNASPALTGCTFSANEASDGGGGVWVYSGSPILTACTFVDNEAINSSANGGGILIGDGSAVITGCVFSSNSASVGGGVFLGGGSAHVTSSVLTGNRASSSGGGLYVSGGTPRITASIIAGNVASTASNGSGVYAGGASLEITGCSIVSNSASAAGSGIYLNSSSATLTNSVLWGNPAPGIALSAGGSIQVAHSAVEGDHPGGTMIIQEDPDFVVVPGNSGTWASVTFDAVQYVTALESTTAHWAPGSLAGLFVQPNASDARWFPIADNTEDTLWVHGDLSDVAGSGVTYSLHDLHLSADSPCIDAGYGCTDPAGCEYEGLTGVTVPETPLWDLQGNHPHDAGKSASNGGAGTPDYLDMGAHEWRP